MLLAQAVAMLTTKVSPFGRRQGVSTVLPDEASSNTSRSVEVVISLCESLKRKTSPANVLDWKPEMYTTFLGELNVVGWSYHIYDHETCSSAKRHEQIKAAVGPQSYSLLPNKGRECGSFFRYIIDNYNELADTTLFLHGDGLSHPAQSPAMPASRFGDQGAPGVRAPPPASNAAAVGLVLAIGVASHQHTSHHLLLLLTHLLSVAPGSVNWSGSA